MGVGSVSCRQLASNKAISRLRILCILLTAITHSTKRKALNFALYNGSCTAQFVMMDITYVTVENIAN